ncbi:hypothetical protein HAX54_017574 [Datura stramonium]|uniref:Uncharacterized protein n=1 Tax=Datura stramonium TaxID=4076 RepID=A0ABS8S0G9_DATST|nr:hypothetical protein [Datura stramonium]
MAPQNVQTIALSFPVKGDIAEPCLVFMSATLAPPPAWNMFRQHGLALRTCLFDQLGNKNTPFSFLLLLNYNVCDTSMLNGFGPNSVDEGPLLGLHQLMEEKPVCSALLQTSWQFDEVRTEADGVLLERKGKKTFHNESTFVPYTINHSLFVHLRSLSTSPENTCKTCCTRRSKFEKWFAVRHNFPSNMTERQISVSRQKNAAPMKRIYKLEMSANGMNTNSDEIYDSVVLLKEDNATGCISKKHLVPATIAHSN